MNYFNLLTLPDLLSCNIMQYGDHFDIPKMVSLTNFTCMHEKMLEVLTILHINF